jgi:asparagine synthase (glutamine-hydrolysing)
MTIADVPLGVFLSGGVDSSAVVAALARSGGTSRRSPSHSTMSRSTSASGPRSSRAYATEHHERVLQPHDVGEALRRLMWHFDEPINDHSFLPTYYLAVEARKEVTVALSGDGADEAFAGYRRYSRIMRRVAARRFLPDRLLARVARVADRHLDPTGLLPAAVGQVRVRPGGHGGGRLYDGTEYLRA